MRITRLMGLALASLVAAPAIHAQSPRVATRSAVFAKDRLARIDSALDLSVREGRLNGGVLLVLRDGRTGYERAFGLADKENARPMTPTSLFRIASQTKALTSAAILMLVEEGRLGLGDRVGRYIPTFAKTTVATATPSGRVIVPANRAITIRDLLTHTAGISYGTDSLVAPLYAEKGLGPNAGWGWYTG